jgi:N-succinyldiaminopimelate aminotransferase
VSELARIGFGVSAPAGTYFVCADIRPLGYKDDVRFCRMLTKDYGVAAIPPSVFFDHKKLGKSWARFAFCKKEETLETAVARLGRLSRAAS